MKRIFTLLAAVFIAATSFAQQSQPIPTDPALRIGKLDNGLTYYIRHNEEPKGQANFYIAQKVGSILEEENQRGLAHFLEHMCFNGTENFPGNSVIEYCERIGVAFGRDLNAYTSIDETVYNIDNVPVGTTPSAVDSCLLILHDWADGLLLKDEDIDSERGVIHEEWRSRMDAQMRMYETVLPEMYPGNRYGQRMPIGTMEVVDNFPYKALRDYYEKWYRPDLQGIIVVGDIDVDEVEAKIKSMFSTIAKPVDPAERVYFEIEDNKEPIVSIAKDKEQPYAMAYVFRKHEAYPDEMKGDLNYLVYQYAQYAASLMVNNRIKEMLQSANPPFIQAQITDDDYFLSKTEGAFYGIVVSAENEIKDATAALYRELLRAGRCGFTESEFERAKAEILTEYESLYNQREKKKSAEYCSEYVRLFLDNEPAAGIETEFALIQQLSPVLTVDIINQVVASWLEEGNLAVCFMLPDKDGVSYPSKDEFLAMLQGVEAENIEPYVDTVSDEPLMSELPVPGKVTGTSQDKFGYTKYTLSNGATVYVKKTDFNADEIIMSAFSEGGTSIYPESEALNLKVLGEVMRLGGVGQFSKTDLTKVLSGKKASVSPKVGMYTEEVSGSTTPKDFETMLQLNYLYFTALRADEDAFASWKTREKASIANRASDPMAEYQDQLYATIYTDDTRISELKADEVDKLDYSRILQIARERFANAGDFTFIFTGNIDEQTALPLIEQYIGSLPSTGAKEKTNADAVDFKKGKVVNDFNRKMESPMATNCFVYSGGGNVTVKSHVAFSLAMRALSTWLLEEIREKEGGTYGITASGNVSSFPKNETLMQIVYQCDPERCDELNQKVREIVQQFAVYGPSEENLSKGREYLIKSYQENLRENSFFQSAMEEYIQTGLDFVDGYEALVNGTTTADASAAVKNLTKQNNAAEVIMRGVANN